MTSINANTIYIKILESLTNSDLYKTHTLLLQFGLAMKETDIMHVKNKIRNGDFDLSNLEVERFELIHNLDRLLHSKKQKKLIAQRVTTLSMNPTRRIYSPPISDIMYKVCYYIHAQFKNAVLTGSAPLAQYFYYLRRNQNIVNQKTPEYLLQVSKTAVRNEDVDLFLPANPRRLQLFQQTYSTLPSNRWKELPSLITNNLLQGELVSLLPYSTMDGYDWYHEELSYIANVLKNRLNIKLTIEAMVDFATGIDQSRCNENSNVRRGFEYGALDLVLLRGITRIYNIKVKTPKGREIVPRLQVIMVDAYPKPGQSWSDFITSSFDVNIAMGVARTDNPVLLCKLNFDPKILDDIRFGRFEFIIRNMVPFFKVYKRMVKYQKKGFHLKKITIHDDCTPWYRNYITRHFQFILGRNDAISMFCKNGICDTLANDMIDNHIMKFLHPVRKIEIESLRFQKQLNEVLMEVVNSNDYKTPGMRYLKEDVDYEETYRWYSENVKPFDIKSWLSHYLHEKGAICIQRWIRRYFVNHPQLRGNILRRHYSARIIQRFWISKLKRYTIRSN